MAHNESTLWEYNWSIYNTSYEWCIDIPLVRARSTNFVPPPSENFKYPYSIYVHASVQLVCKFICICMAPEFLSHPAQRSFEGGTSNIFNSHTTIWRFIIIFLFLSLTKWKSIYATLKICNVYIDFILTEIF